jgi:hypothetical protein
MRNLEVDIYTPTDPRLGRHKEHDSASLGYAVPIWQAQPKRATTHWPSPFGPLNQSELGSCTGNALAGFLNTDYAMPTRTKTHAAQQFTETDAVKLYELATTLDAIPGSYPPTDTGSTGLGVCKAGIKLGYLSAYNWVFGFTSLQITLEFMPLITGTLWTQPMFNPVNGLVKVGPINDATVAGGHEYLLTGIDYQNQVIEARNSWGDVHDWPGCKPGGYFAIGFKDFQQLLGNGADVTAPKGL